MTDGWDQDWMTYINQTHKSHGTHNQRQNHHLTSRLCPQLTLLTHLKVCSNCLIHILLQFLLIHNSGKKKNAFTYFLLSFSDWPQLRVNKKKNHIRNWKEKKAQSWHHRKHVLLKVRRVLTRRKQRVQVFVLPRQFPAAQIHRCVIYLKICEWVGGICQLSSHPATREMFTPYIYLLFLPWILNGLI